MIKYLFSALLLYPLVMSGQEKGVISGAFETNANVFLRDSAINAINTPQYDRQFFGGEAWLNLNYSIKDFTLGVRFDMFNNSNLRNPTDSYSGIGIGRWYVQKRLDKVEISAGYLYDQIGSGLLFRAFENRPLFIDNALYGARIKYNFNDSWNITGFAGKQKNAFDTYSGNLKGVRLEGFLSLGSEESPVTLAPGIGFVNRTISDENMAGVADALRTYLEEDRFIPNHNVFGGTFYNTTQYKGFSLYTEVTLKSDDIFYNPFAEKREIIGSSIGKLEQKTGSVLYTSISYSKGNLGINVEAKRTENFNFRIDPNQRLLRGLVNFLLPLNRQNTYRLTARYSPAAQDLSEMAYAADIRYKFSKAFSAAVNVSDIRTIEGDRLFQEIYTELVYKHKRKWQLMSGIQLLTYNQEVYEMKSEVPLVKTIVPYVDFLYKFSPSRSLRTEFQYMKTEQDFGSWLFGLAEYSIAPKWNFEISGMFNSKPKKENPKGEIEKILYPTAGVVYLHDAQRYSLRYVKQVEGVVCSGGICRLEPAFSGFRFSMNTTF
ncbi:MAG: hypothetical protein IPK35_14585 [Saprospiraceae bacterium]|nr:hypothetical protein [Saprospiraceae bacterium]